MPFEPMSHCVELGNCTLIPQRSETCALVANYGAYIDISLPTSRENLSVPSSRVKKSKKKAQKQVLAAGDRMWWWYCRKRGYDVLVRATR